MIVVLFEIKQQKCCKYFLLLSDASLDSGHFITVRSEAFFVNTQVITDTIQSLITTGQTIMLSSGKKIVHKEK